MRINKYLAQNDIASRREADELIRRGQIHINGRVAKLGDQVSEDDKVTVGKNAAKNLVYYAFNKPVGIVTCLPQRDEKEIADISKIPEKVFPVGRLDKDSHGLIILTNDGRVTEKLLSPEKKHEKEYFVSVDKSLKDNFLRKMGEGVKLDDGYRTQKAKVKKINDFLFSIILTEGKRRQIRRMCAALGYSVRDLKRVRIMNIKIEKLAPGKERRIEAVELDGFMEKLGLSIARKLSPNEF